MIVISETDLGVVCCTRPAFYIVTAMHRLYCSQCTAELLQQGVERQRHRCMSTSRLIFC
jgi:hypothetical protein